MQFIDRKYFEDKEYYKDFYFIYVVTGVNYIRPIKKSFPMVPKGTNVVILTNTPRTLKDIKVDFNLIVEDLETYRTDWSRINEPVIDIEDEQGYMDEYRRRFDEEYYRYPMGIMRFGMNWAIKNNVKKFILIDSGCKIGFDLNEMVNGFNRLSELSKNKNLVMGHAWMDDVRDILGNHIRENSPLAGVLKKYIPNFSWDTYTKTVETYLEKEKIGTVGFDGYCYGFWFHDIELVKIAYNLWCDLVERCYEVGLVDPKRETAAVVDFEFYFSFISDIFSKYYNTLISHHFGIARHFYHPENDFTNVKKMPHLNLLPAKTRKEFIKLNREKIASVNGENISRLIIDEFDEN